MPGRFLSPIFGSGLPMDRRPSSDPFLDLHREVNRLFDDVFRSSGGSSYGGSFGGMMTPRIDVVETDNELRIAAELPGVSQEDVEVMLEDDMLTLRGEKRSSHEEGQGSRRIAERSYGRFERSLQLPFRPEEGRVQASFEHGVLTITLPKPAPAPERARRIEVRGGGSQPSEQGAQSTASKRATGNRTASAEASGGQSPNSDQPTG